MLSSTTLVLLNPSGMDLKILFLHGTKLEDDDTCLLNIYAALNFSYI